MVSNDVSQARTYFDCDMSEPDQFATADGTACVFSARCPRKESANEDAAAVVPCGDRGAVLIVADGFGGGPAGEQAARLAVEAMQLCVADSLAENGLLRSGIVTGFEKANASVLALGVGAATTLAVVEVSGGVARPFYVGDSMILVVGGRGKIKLQTMPHSPVGYGIEAGLLDANEAMHHEHRHIVSNFIGSADMHIALGSPVVLARHDTVLVGSDGLFDNLYCDGIAGLVCRGPQRQAAQRLAAASLHRMQSDEVGHPSKPDDLTFITFRLATHR